MRPSPNFGLDRNVGAFCALAPDRWCLRVLDLDPIGRAAGAIDRAEPDPVHEWVYG